MSEESDKTLGKEVSSESSCGSSPRTVVPRRYSSATLNFGIPSFGGDFSRRLNETESREYNNKTSDYCP